MRLRSPHRNRGSDLAIFFCLVALAAAGLYWENAQALALVPLSAWLSCRYGCDRLVAHMRRHDSQHSARDHDLHDALLQNIQGLILHFQAVKERISDPAIRDVMEQALRRTDKVLVDSREQAVTSARLPLKSE